MAIYVIAGVYNADHGSIKQYSGEQKRYVMIVIVRTNDLTDFCFYSPKRGYLAYKGQQFSVNFRALDFKGSQAFLKL